MDTTPQRDKRRIERVLVCGASCAFRRKTQITLLAHARLGLL